MDIPLSMLLLLCLIFLLIGIVVAILLQYYIFFKFGDLPGESDEQRDINVKYSLPMSIQQTARAFNATAKAATVSSSSSSSPSPSSTLTYGTNTNTDTTPLVSVNFVMQFLFHELKNSNRVRKWFYRKLSLELDELIAKTTTGKLFDKLTIKELDLGEQFPQIKTLHVHNVELDETEGRIENLDLLLELHYAGNFRTTIDADMVLGKKGSLTLKVKQLAGLARLQFTRKPYTHWSLSFLGDPELDLAIESKIQGRQMQSNITSLISNQIRKAVRRKHTLPNYKLRYKPFFHKSPDDETGDIDIQPNGLLEVKVSELSRLMCPPHITDVYCTLTLASLAFVEARQKDDRNVIISLDVEIHKAKNQQIGIFFKQCAEQYVEIEAVLPNTPACKSNLKTGDVLLAIEGKRISSIQQVAKVVKSLQKSVFSLRIERIIPGIIRNDAILEDLELYEDLGDLHTGYGVGGPKQCETDLSVKSTLMTRHTSAEKGTSSESSLSNTPTNSPKKSKLIAKALKKTINRENSESARNEDVKSKQKLTAKLDESKVRINSPNRPNSGESVHDVEHYYQHSTVDCALKHLIYMEDLSQFKLDAHCKFLNVCVYGKSPTESTMLGFVNILINHVLAECCETSLSQCWRSFELNPPIPQDLKSHQLYTQSGFNANLCFGDILFAFTWDGNPSLQSPETSAKHMSKLRIKSVDKSDKTEDSGVSDTISLKSLASDTVSVNSTQPKSHNFVRTHFQRATQCDYCGKKIWLKDAVQCHDCSMCCHKKCINKCQNATVCGPVDCSSALQQAGSMVSIAPEFTVTEVFDTSEAEEALPGTSDEEQTQTKQTPNTTAGLEVHRSSLTGLLAQGIKRVNSANNLAIPGIVSSFTSGVAGAGNNAKSLPPSPQHTPSRKPSLIGAIPNVLYGSISSFVNPFDIVTLYLESLPSELSILNEEQINAITEPIINISKEDDVMTLAKNSSKTLYCDYISSERVQKINLLLGKLRIALDSETAMQSSLTASSKSNTGTDGVPQVAVNQAISLCKTEERVQALSMIMLYLCTGLQHAQGVAFH